MAAPYCPQPGHVLLIRNLLTSLEWKFIGEGMEAGEFPIHTLLRGLWEEGGFLCRPDDPEINIKEVRPGKRIFGKRTHIQYFYKVRMSYVRLRDLSGKKFPGKDKDEFFETGTFALREIEKMPDFFKPHHMLYNELLGYAA